MTNRSRYSTAPTYGMQKRPAPKKQTAPAGPAYPPQAQAPNGPYAPPVMPYGQPGVRQPQSASYMPPQAAYAAQQAGYAQQPGYAPRQAGYAQPQNAIPPQPVPYFTQQPYAQQPLPQEYAMRPTARYTDNWLQILMLGVLPVLFLLTLLIASPALKIIFIGLGVLGLIAMWMQNAFVISARSTLTLVYGALILVSLVSLISGAAPRDTTASTRGSGLTAQGYQANQGPTPTPEGMVSLGGTNAQATTAEPAPTAAPESGENSAAWQTLRQFFEYWIANKTGNMVELVSPAWKAEQPKPDTALFLLMGNRTPVEYAFEKISNTEQDSTRTITMTALIDKNNGRPQVRIRYQVLMLKDNNQWYVDPSSLISNDEVTETTATGDTTTAGDTGTTGGTVIATAEPTATPGPKTKLYYNKAGGKFYHANPECESVNKKYYPLASFYYRALNDSEFKALLPCPFCDAPDRP